jgi:hypothetical protein
LVRVLARVRRVSVWVGGQRPSLASPRMQRTDEKTPYVTPARACQILHTQGASHTGACMPASTRAGASHVLECGQCTQQAWPWLARQPITPRVYIEIDDEM